MMAWSAYLIGVPAWIVLLTSQHNWIAASVEAGGIPAMVLGLYTTYHTHRKVNLGLNRLVALLTYTALTSGVLFSLNHHGGLVSVSQLLEIGITVGFLIGSYLMAKNNPKGWLFFMLMNISTAVLMLLQDKYILMTQQLVSLCFVVYGFRQSTLLTTGSER